MKSKKSTIRSGLVKNWVWPQALFRLLMVSGVAEADQVIMPSPQSSPTIRPLWQQSETGEFDVFSPEGTLSVGQEQPFQFGPVTARPHISYRAFYADGLQASPGNQQHSFIHEISPGMELDIGTHWVLDYTPTLRFYLNHRFKDELNNAVTLTGGTAYEDWIFGVSQSYSSSVAALVETGTQTDQEIYATKLRASYAFNSKLSLDMGLYQNLLFTKNLQSSRDWSTLEWLNYQFWPRLNVGLGAGFGYVNVDAGADQTYEQFSGRVNWRATDKISFQINGGLENRQFLGGDAASLLSPIFGASIQYKPLEQTLISLNATRSVSPSLSQDQVTENTGISCNLNQRVFQKYHLDLNAGYNTTKYVATASTLTANRNDDYFTFSVRLSRSVLKRGMLAIFYQYGKNTSSQPGFGYTSSQVGIEISYKF